MISQTGLKFEIDHPNEHAGWMECFLTFNGTRHRLWASNAFPPFPQILQFLRALSAQRLPAQFFWDEEGIGAYFEAWPLSEDDPKFRLNVIHDTGGMWVNAELRREDVIAVFLEALRDLVENAAMSLHGWDIKPSDVQDFEEWRRRGVALRTEIAVAQTVSFQLLGAVDMEVPSLWMYLDVAGLTPKVLYVLNDTDAFWPNWFAFLEKILRAQLPAEIFHVNESWIESIQEEVHSGAMPSVEEYRRLGTVIHARPLPHSEHFRLSVLDTDFDYLAFPIIEENVSCRAFVSGFCRVFEEFLKEYHPWPAEDGRIFDLRTLPLDSLKRLLNDNARADQ